MVTGNPVVMADAVVQFAQLVFQIAPFRAPGDMPAYWSVALRAWIEGRPAWEVISIGGDDGVDLLQDALTYRLPWAMEAVRVHAMAVGEEGADQLEGLAAMAVEAGSANRAVITLLRAGLSSREAAMAAVATTGASFDDRAGMLKWLRSEDVKHLTDRKNWPTTQSRHAWLQFVESRKKSDLRKWRREIQTVPVQWSKHEPDVNSHVVVEPDIGSGFGLVLTPDMLPLGALKSALGRPRRTIVSARVGLKPGTVTVEYFGPRDDLA